ncbi:MAG: head GIN domain-containing protein [Chitinophagales bacterium]
MKSQTSFYFQTLSLVFCFLLTTSIFADVENRNVGQFDVLHVKGSIDVMITQSSDYQVRVEAPSDKMGNIITEVENGELVVHIKTPKGKNNWSWKDNMNDVKVYVSAKSLKGLYLSGSGDVEGSGLTSTIFKVSIAGSGDLDIEVDAHSIEAKIAGSGDMDIAGSTKNLDVSIAGSGEFDAFDLKTKDCEIQIAGSGDCNVYVSESLDVRINGSGNVAYKGNPSNVNKNIRGSGNVDKH